MNPIVSVPGAFSSIINTFLIDDKLSFLRKKNHYLSEDFMPIFFDCSIGLIKLFKDCVWCFLIGKKLRLPSFLIDVLDAGEWQCQLRFENFSYKECNEFLHYLRCNNLLEVVDCEKILTDSIRKKIFESAYVEYHRVVSKNPRILSPEILRIVGDVYTSELYDKEIGILLFENLLHKYFSLITRIPVVFIDGRDHDNDDLPIIDPYHVVIQNNVESEIYQGIYLPALSLIPPDSQFFTFDKAYLDTVIEDLKSLIESPLQKLFQKNYDLITSSHRKYLNRNTEADEISLLKEFLSDHKRIDTIKKIYFMGEQVIGRNDSLIPFITVFDYINTYMTYPEIQEIEKDNIKKHTMSSGLLKHLYFTDINIRLDDL